MGMNRIIFTLFFMLLVGGFWANHTSADSNVIDDSPSNLIIFEEVDFQEVDSQEVGAMSIKPSLERFNGAGLGLRSVGNNAQANSFARRAGYNDAHDLKYEYLGDKAKVSLYNMYYSTVNRYVYLLDRNNRGVKTDEKY